MPSPPVESPSAAPQRGIDPDHALPAPGVGEATIHDPAHMLPTSTAEPPAKGSLLRKILIPLVLIAVVGLLVWRIRSNNAEVTATNKRAAQSANRATPVLTTFVQQNTVPFYLTALGTVTAYNTVTLRSRVDGQLLRVNFREGQAVKQGQLLLQIDPRPFEATLAQAEGQLAKDEATHKNAQAEAARYTALYQAGVISKESEQAQVTNLGTAGGSMQSDIAAIQSAKVNLSYTNIYAPTNGVVGLRLVDPGNIVHASDTTGLVVITQVHPIAVIFTLPEDQLPQVQQAMHGGRTLSVEAYDRTDSHKIADGKLLTIDNQIDTTTGTAKLKAVFNNSDDSLYPNQFVNVRLVLQQRENAIVVPTAAIQSGTKGAFVFVVHPGPTPANKRPQGAAQTDASGAASGGAPAAAAPAGGAPAGGPSAGGSKQRGSGSGAGGGPRGPVAHVDAVSVRVDFAQGPNSILSPGSLRPGEQVVIDGQERLIDGATVVPQVSQNPTGPPTGGGSRPGKLGAGDSGAATPGRGVPAVPAPIGNGQPGQHHRGQGGQGATDGGGSGGGGSRP